MKYLSDFRTPERVHVLAQKIKDITTHQWQLMEICGGQTHSIAKYGLIELLPSNIELIHGPGCPVCVTSKEIIDAAILLAKRKNVIFCTFGDMMRVPGSEYDLLKSKADGGDVRMIYSPLEAVQLAQQHPQKEVVLFAVGFETTAPAHAKAVLQAKSLNLKNFSLLTSLVLVPPAIDFILQSDNNKVQGFLAAGHVCTIMGTHAYHPLSTKYHVPIIITGFEPVDILLGIYHCVKQLEAKTALVENQYQRIVKPDGNQHAQTTLFNAFEVVDTLWRGIGMIPNSGLKIKPDLVQFNALEKFNLNIKHVPDKPNHCISGLILQGQKKPPDCPLFGKLCTPDAPQGAPMVSTEGACSAYYLYQGDRCVS